MPAVNAREQFRINLRHYMTLRNATQADVSAALHITPSTMSDWCLGKKYPRVDAMQRLADYLQVPIAALTDGDAPDPFAVPGVERASFYRVPILGAIACGTPILAEENLDGEASVEAGVRCDFALRCKGDSMSPRLIEGDLVFIRRQPDVDDGQIAAVLIDGEATLKHVYHLPHRGGVQLVSDNPAYPPMLYVGEPAGEVRVLGRAVGYQRVLI